MIGFFGDIVFETSDKRVYTFKDLKRDASSRWVTHDVIGAKPASEFLGPGLDTISFTIDLNGNHGVKPRVEMDLWLRKERAGEVQPLIIGESYLGVDKWKITSVSQAYNTVLNKGELLSASIDISLEEYVEKVGVR